MKTNLKNRIKNLLKELMLIQSSPVIFKKGKNPDELTNTQKSFLIWNAERLNISQEESQERYSSSWRSIIGGHAGPDFRLFTHLSHDFYNVFYSDKGDEVYAAYKLHSHMHFLRYLSYPEPQWDENNLIVKHFHEYSNIDILDYGCGLAHVSRTLASYLKNKGKVVRLFLADIPTIRKEFLLWLGVQSGIETKFLDCTHSKPIPKLPGCDICIATEFFEHVYDPLKYFDEMHSVLRKDGLLITNIADHEKEFMHVTPNLQSLRNKIQELNYDIIKENQILRKTS